MNVNAPNVYLSSLLESVLTYLSISVRAWFFRIL
jgi:hypothetical protein